MTEMTDLDLQDESAATAPAGDGWIAWAAAGTFGGIVLMAGAFGAGLIGGAALELPAATPAMAQIAVRTGSPEPAKRGAAKPMRLAASDADADGSEQSAGDLEQSSTEMTADDAAASPASDQSDTYDPGVDPWAVPAETAETASTDRPAAGGDGQTPAAAQ